MLTVFSPNFGLRRALDLEDRRLERRARRRTLRELAAGPFSTSSTLATLSVNQTLRQPRIISRDLLNVIIQRGGFLADQLFVAGSPEEAAGGSMIYQRSGSGYVAAPGEVEEIAEDADWPRAGWTEEMRTAVVKQYGLEIPLSNLAIRRNQQSQLTIAERRLANQIVKFVDGKAITLLRTDPDILTGNAANWTLPATDIISDLANAQEAMDVLDEGIFGGTLVLPKTMRVNFLANTAIRDALKGQNGSEQVRTGQVENILGLDRILFTTRIADDEALLVATDVAGVIADEAVDPSEGWAAYDPGPGFKPIYVQVYKENRPKRQVVAAGRWPVMALIEPRGIYKFTTTTS